MAHLTEIRFAKIKSVLDRYRDTLQRTRRLEATVFERELRDTLNMGYRDLKTLIIELSEREGYEHLAARYMESGVPGVVSEFQGRLAELYGIDHFHAPEKEQMKQAYWSRAFPISSKQN